MEVQPPDTEGSYVDPIFQSNHFSGAKLKIVIRRAGREAFLYDDERERVYAQSTALATRV